MHRQRQEAQNENETYSGPNAAKVFPGWDPVDGMSSQLIGPEVLEFGLY